MRKRVLFWREDEPTISTQNHASFAGAFRVELFEKDMELEKIKDKIENATIAVASVGSKNKPYAIAIMYAKVRDGKIVITNNFMKNTIENLKKNPYVSLVF